MNAVKIVRKTPKLSSAPKEEWIELFPTGISVNSTLARPVLVLKDTSGSEVLPVWMHPLDAGVAVAEMSEASGLTPHAVTRKILEAVGLKLDSCSFVDLVGHHQFIQLAFKNAESGTMILKVRADEAMSFCLQAKARFFSTRAYMQRCRSINAELGQLEHNLASGSLPRLQSELEISSKKHPYMM